MSRWSKRPGFAGIFATVTCSQERGLHAGKAAGAVHRCADVTRARLPVLSTGVRVSRWQGRQYCPHSGAFGAGKVASQQHLEHRHTLSGGVSSMSWPSTSGTPAAVPEGDPVGPNSSHNRPTNDPQPTRNPSVMARSAPGARGACVAGEVTATRRFGVLQMSGLRSKVPLHLVPTRV